MEPLGEFAMRHLSIVRDEYEEMLQDNIEVKVRSGKYLAKNVTLA